MENQDKIAENAAWYHKINVPEACFILLTLRIVFLGSGFGEAIALIALAGMYGWNNYLNRQNMTWMQSVITHVNDLKKKVEVLHNKHQFENKFNEKPKQRKW